ncbi:MAG: SH3 domain-containing protein [Chloroflexi bacterium]|nr:SH3 domain-containing protein [Chloroflexota bacterium]
MLTAPPNPTATATGFCSHPRCCPRQRPFPPPDYTLVPEELTIDFTRKSQSTGGVGVRVRGGPSTSNAQVVIAPEGAVVLVLDGPEAANDFLWWQIRMADGTEGWTVSDYLIPAARPRN